ncbi:phosphatidate cytidylyltransferase [Aurantiacibacter hainanensis]|uniref:phosphatidate cytidylyltransferase n=1 Tax=Aurantiacibacter hainanensis TaxID=3076114 RepID=UPI0030C68B42
MEDVDDLPPERRRDRIKRYAKKAVTVPLSVRTSDLPKRAASAVVMVALAGAALWAGGWLWAVFCVLVALGVLWEWRGLVFRFADSISSRILWMLAGITYVSIAAFSLFAVHGQFEGVGSVLMILGAVIATDIGAYFAGRTIGGPKIAPRISPSKTWAGLFGGMVGAAAMLASFPIAWDNGLCRVFYPPAELPPGFFQFDGPCSGIIRIGLPETILLWAVIGGALVAIVAQAGDFFESWMKRKAGMKDSGKLIPGHGGLFDRVDGLLAVLFILGIAGYTFSA